MKPSEALKQLKSGQDRNFIILSGEDHYLKQYMFQHIMDALKIDVPELNLSIFEERPDPHAVLCAMETLPFMSDKRMTVLKSTDILSTQAAGDLSAPYMTSKMPASNYFLIWAQGNADKRKAFVKFVIKQGMFIECAAMQDQEICSFIRNRAKQKGLLVSPKNAQIINEIAGGDLSTIVNEVDKLSCVCQGEISTADIEKYAIKSMQYNVYKIHDLMVSGHPQQAYTLICKMLEEDNNPIGFITLLSNNFRQMLVARACRDARFPDHKTISHIIEATGAREFAARRALENCKPFSAKKIRAAIQKFAKMDFDAKQGIVVLKTDLFALLVDIYQS